jgi:peptidoglycan/xylan/chitin deacetylase (PgdA/CDA1 family)
MKSAPSERRSEFDSLKSAAKSALYFAGVFNARAQWARLRRPGRRLLILVYHNLSSPHDETDLERRIFELRPVTPLAHFECLLDVLARSYRVVSLSQGARELRESPDVDQLSVAITFDDGYRTFLTRAMPILERYEFPVTMFLATDYIDQRKAFWWDELTQLVAAADLTPEFIADLAGVAGIGALTGSANPLETGRSRKHVLAVLERVLAPMPSAMRIESFERLRTLFVDSGVRPAEPVPLLTWDEIRALGQRKISFGAHTCSHMNLAGAAPEAREREIGESVRRLNAELREPVELFAYPYGMEPDGYLESVPTLERHGIRYARTMAAGVNERDTDPFLLRRAPVTEVTAPHRLRMDLLEASVP